MSSLFSLDAPILKTLGLLFSNPGKLFRRYLSGQRKRYYKPVTFFILTTVVFLLFRWLLDYNPMIDAEKNTSTPEAAKFLIDAGRLMFSNIDKMLFLFVFSLAISMKLFFYRKNTLAEFVAISFYMLGAYTLLSTINMFVFTFVKNIFQPISRIFMFFYFIWAMVSYFEERKLLVFFKSILTTVFGFALYVVLGLGLAFIIILIGT